MKQIDLEPTGYRKQDRETGRWVQNINKPMARWMALAGIAFMAVCAFKFASEGGNPVVVVFSAAMGTAIGACLILSLKSTDW